MSIKKLNYKKILPIASLFFIATLGFTQKAQADGFIIPHEKYIFRPVVEVPNFSIKYHQVNVTIKDQYAKTSVDQVFQNNSNQLLEGTYFFPLPEEATLSNFSMYMGGEAVAGKMYTKEEARKIYEDIVRKRKDPAILEFINRGFFKASVFPIPSHGEAKTKIQYEELMKHDNNTFKYVYTLNTEKFSNNPIEKVELNVKVKTTRPLKSIYSPTHNIKVKKLNDHEAIVTYEEKSSKPDTEFVLYYNVSEQEFDINLLSYKDPTEDTGYFLLLGSPKYSTKETDLVPKNIVFVMDTSGSMSGKKITQAKDALKFCIDNLNKKDDFDIIAFSDFVRPLKDNLMVVNDDNTKKALNFASGLEASGGTNIDSAMKTTLNLFENNKKQSIIMFLTDGQPTVGITNNDEILDNVKTNNKNNSKIFVFGVGYDVNIHFLDKLAQKNHGYSEYVRPTENIETSVASIFSKINTPVLSNIKVDFADKGIIDTFPKDLPDIFKGSQLMILGKYKDEGKTKIKISGNVAGKHKEMNYKVNFKSEKENNFIPKLWASRKIGYLLDELRLNKNSNKEIIDEVVSLSKKYGIVTEFTSFLVADDIALSEAPSVQLKRTEEKMDMAKSVSKGSWAVSQSQNSTNLKLQTSNAPGFYYDQEGKKVDLNSKVKYAGQKSFFLKNQNWVDPNFKEEKILKIKSFSEAYFEILNKVHGAESYFMLGSNISVNIHGVNIQVGDNGEEKLTKEQKKLLKL